ncbi:hypothetical protein RJ639_018456 [Escallonia herrerae]|uniref:Pentatricopeptide repeat-containing protein n=1 Tax=Escallonia herrerae TaxID=1293975 RepID=A0AA88V7V4_9ASTE|nr:hypothetical protein RJ639_018456 [Escallonia herrerae]
MKLPIVGVLLVAITRITKVSRLGLVGCDGRESIGGGYGIECFSCCEVRSRLAAVRHGKKVHCQYLTFKKMPVRNMISWNSMISGFAQNGMEKGHAEQIEEAEDLTCKAALPNACTTSTNFIVAECIAVKMMELDPDYYLSYILLANVYRTVGRWDDAVNIRKLMEERRVKKKLPGKS